MAEDIYTGHTPAELVLQAVIEQGISLLQQDETLLKRLIQRYQPVTQDQILNYFTQNEILVRLGFAREPWALPQISIILASETEQRFIGDEIAIRDRILDPAATIEVGDPVGTNAIGELTKAPFDLRYENLVEGPLPEGCRIQIGNEQLTYDLVTPDAIVPPAEESTSGTLRVVARHVNRTTQAAHAEGAEIICRQLEREVGVHQLATYRIDIMHDNADIVLFLQSLVKWVLLIRWAELDDEGFTEMQLSGSDFMPRPQFYPEFIYMRSLSLSTRISEGVPQPLVEALSLQVFPTLTGVTITSQPEVPLGN